MVPSIRSGERCVPRCNLKFLGVGNEQWDYDDAHGDFGPVFTARLKKFSDALRAKYPDLKLIGTTGPNSEGWDFDLLQPRMKELKVDLYDEHYYRNEDVMRNGSSPMVCATIPTTARDQRYLPANMHVMAATTTSGTTTIPLY